MGCFPLEFQLNALRDRYGGLARAVSFDKFVVLVMDLHHWFPLATPYRIVAIASRYQPEAAAATGSGGMLAEVTNSHISSDGINLNGWRMEKKHQVNWRRWRNSGKAGNE